MWRTRVPKIKTNRGAAKRFRKTANGFKFRRAGRNHILTKKDGATKRSKRANGMIDSSDVAHVARMLVNA